MYIDSFGTLAHCEGINHMHVCKGSDERKTILSGLKLRNWLGSLSQRNHMLTYPNTIYESLLPASDSVFNFKMVVKFLDKTIFPFTSVVL